MRVYCGMDEFARADIVTLLLFFLFFSSHKFHFAKKNLYFVCQCQRTIFNPLSSFLRVDECLTSCSKIWCIILVSATYTINLDNVIFLYFYLSERCQNNFKLLLWFDVKKMKWNLTFECQKLLHSHIFYDFIFLCCCLPIQKVVLWVKNFITLIFFLDTHFTLENLNELKKMIFKFNLCKKFKMSWS
jgi:hypothetical protein